MLGCITMMVMIGTATIDRCDVEALEISPLKPNQTIVLMNYGKRYTMKEPLEVATKKLFSDMIETPTCNSQDDKEDLKGWGI